MKPSYLHPYSASLITHHSTSNSFMPITLGKGSKDSFTIRGWQLWLKHFISTLYALYFRSVFIVSSCVLKEFIRTRGTLLPYLLFNCCGVKCNKMSIIGYLEENNVRYNVTFFTILTSLVFNVCKSSLWEKRWEMALITAAKDSYKNSCYSELKNIPLYLVIFLNLISSF